MAQYLTKPQVITAFCYKESEAKSLPWRIIEYGLANGGTPAVHVDGGDDTIWCAEGQYLVQFPDSTMLQVLDEEEFEALVDRQLP